MDGFDLSTGLDAIAAWHHPVEEGHGWRVLVVEALEGGVPVGGFTDFVAPFGQREAEGEACSGIVICDQDFHGFGGGLIRRWRWLFRLR
ncbi:MAG: hypothetical protein RI897_782 [Verrucomicrobiota bacterium]